MANTWLSLNLIVVGDISSILNADITLMSLSIWLFTGSMRFGLPYPRTLY